MVLESNIFENKLEHLLEIKTQKQMFLDYKHMIW